MLAVQDQGFVVQAVIFEVIQVQFSAAAAVDEAAGFRAVDRFGARVKYGALLRRDGGLLGRVATHGAEERIKKGHEIF